MKTYTLPAYGVEVGDIISEVKGGKGWEVKTREVEPGSCRRKVHLNNKCYDFETPLEVVEQ